MGVNEDEVWASVGQSLMGATKSQSTGMYGSLLGINVPTNPKPDQPARTTFAYIRQAEERIEKRLNRLREILPIRIGRQIPDDDDLLIGDARRLTLAVLFLDICKFSWIPNETDEQQDNVLKLVNLFMAEMLQVVKMHGGVFEKNTGDGLMAYFKTGSEAECARVAVDAAVTMHCYNDRVISPRLKTLGLQEIKFRVGIEVGRVTIANVGIVGGDHRSLVAIGTPANVACKLMTLLPNGGIVLGASTRALLSENWKSSTTSLASLKGFVLIGTEVPYPAWELTYRVPVANDWGAIFGGLMGGS